MENSNNEEIISEIQNSDESEAIQAPPAKSYKGLKTANIVLFVLSTVCFVVCAVLFGMFVSSDAIGRAVLIVVLFPVPLISIIVGAVSLILSILVVKFTKSAKPIWFLDILFIVFEIISVILCFVLTSDAA